MGHINQTYFKKLEKVAIGVNFEEKEMKICETCVTRVLTQEPFKVNYNFASTLLELYRISTVLLIQITTEEKYFFTWSPSSLLSQLKSSKNQTDQKLTL